ncbi:hypothetical protein FACS1894200_14010 [Spirochaetia bacterium]|nr:hypothetical protein FACS1894200_14010 [Spirochaetia bacterium]
MKTDTLVKHEGLNVLYEHLGPVDMERFIALMSRELFDYTKWHEELDETMSVREMSKKAMEYQNRL